MSVLLYINVHGHLELAVAKCFFFVGGQFFPLLNRLQGNS
jgi:hypothetical protein